MYIFTVDFEDWFDRATSLERKSLPVSRLKFGWDSLSAILEKTNTKPTFFIQGCTAERYPSLIAEIADKYDIGTHGYEHYNCNDITTEVFEKDLRKSVRILQDITGRKINKYRSPYFSLPNKEFLDIVAANGIEIDCSLASIEHSYGQKVLDNDSPCRILCNGIEIKELPPTSIGLGGWNFGFLGGGYFRLFPYALIKYWTEKKKDYSLAYIHPQDLDRELPLDYSESYRMEEKTFKEKLRSHVGLKTVERKLERFLTEFDFVDVETAARETNWEKMPLVEL